MEKVKSKCTAIMQAENRGQVTFTVLDKDKKTQIQVSVAFIDPKEAAKYVHGKDYNITIEPAK